jgi:hypothetical protein
MGRLAHPDQPPAPPALFQNMRHVSREIFSPGQGTAVQQSVKALFSFENFLVFGTVALSFLFDKHCLIME